jgi:hypothetical protein
MHCDLAIKNKVREFFSEACSPGGENCYRKREPGSNRPNFKAPESSLRRFEAPPSDLESKPKLLNPPPLQRTEGAMKFKSVKSIRNT